MINLLDRLPTDVRSAPAGGALMRKRCAASGLAPARASVALGVALGVALLAGVLLTPLSVGLAQQPKSFSRADTLRGSITPERAWWDVVFYDLHVAVSLPDSSVKGFNGITYEVVKPAREMQIDLMTPLEVDSMVQDGGRLTYRREGDVFFVPLRAPQAIGSRKTITVYYHGKPKAAENPPWDGGIVWAKDEQGNPWIATAVQRPGASLWWPAKNTQADEPDSQRVAITVPDPLVDVSNGRLRATTKNADGTTTYEWFVANPVNNYDVAINAGGYAHFSDTYAGELGTLTLDFWPMAYNLDKARQQFQQVKPMLACFERWFGPFPWYEDGYKLVETPYLGMEHQSAVAYGNQYQNGYLGNDLSGTGRGLSWDYIIVHESGHEWFGNNITAKDVADEWIQEGFTTYSEGLYVECQSGKEAGAEYLVGLRERIKNDEPVVGRYGVHSPGSENDMYFKGANMLHTIRQLVNDDARWRSVLRGLNKTFWHQTVTGRQVQDYVSQHTGLDLSKVFQQYLTTTQVPVLEYAIRGSTLSYRWTNVVPGFDMPVRVTLSDDTYTLVHPSTTWKTAELHLTSVAEFKGDVNFYVQYQQATAAPPPAGGR